MNKKKVLIITVQKAPNFGACLQAYALWKYISDKGFDCKIIDLLRPYHKDFIYTKGFDPLNKYERGWLLNLKIEYIRPLKYYLKKLLCLSKSEDINTFKKRSFGKKEIQLCEDFNNNISYTRVYRSIGDLYKNPPQADLYITGSDQLWNPTQPYSLAPYFLTFVNNGGRKYSYATSIGVSELSNHTKKLFSRWLTDYEMISVRETEAVNIIKGLTNNSIVRCCDPTFLFSGDYWMRMASKRIVKEKYIFVFSLDYDQRLLEYASHVQNKNKYKIISYQTRYKKADIDKFNLEMIDNVGPLEWLSLINNAELVLTNSFHGSVFSILMHTPFRVAISNNRGSRILSLLKDVGLECLLLTENITNLDIPKIDFNKSDLHVKCISDFGKKYLNKILS